jgi:hypothetical protein
MSAAKAIFHIFEVTNILLTGTTIILKIGHGRDYSIIPLKTKITIDIYLCQYKKTALRLENENRWREEPTLIKCCHKLSC